MAPELRTWLRVLICVIFPLIAGLLAIPIVGEISAKELVSGGLHPLLVTLIVAFYVGLAAAPGYVFAAIIGKDMFKQKKLKRAWARISLILATVSSIAATGFTFVAFWPLVIFPVISLLLTIWLFSLGSVRSKRCPTT